MTTEQEKNSESTLDWDEQTEASLSYDVATKKPKRGLWLGAITLLIGGTLFWRAVSNNEQQTVETTNNVEQARLTVKTVDAEIEPIQAWSYADGTVSAVIKKHLTFQAEGTIDYIKKVEGRYLREGDRVKQGELLAKVDRRKYDADIDVAAAGQIEAKNQVLNAVANLRQAEESLAQAQADLQKAKTNEAFAQVDLKRYQELATEGGIAQWEVDVKEIDYKNAQTAAIASEAAVRSAQAQVTAAQTEVETAEAGVQSANAKLTQSNIESEDTELIAPFDGVISRLNIREGEYWSPQIVNVTGDYQGIIERLPIIIIKPDQFEVQVKLPAFQGEDIRPGQRAFIILDRDHGVPAKADRSKSHSGTITGQDLMKLASAQGTVFSVGPSVSPGERSVRVTIRINQGVANLQDGEQVSAWIAVEEKEQALVAPFKAFVFRDRS